MKRITWRMIGSLLKQRKTNLNDPKKWKVWEDFTKGFFCVWRVPKTVKEVGIYRQRKSERYRKFCTDGSTKFSGTVEPSQTRTLQILSFLVKTYLGKVGADFGGENSCFDFQTYFSIKTFLNISKIICHVYFWKNVLSHLKCEFSNHEFTSLITSSSCNFVQEWFA